MYNVPRPGPQQQPGLDVNTAPCCNGRPLRLAVPQWKLDPWTPTWLHTMGIYMATDV